MTTTTRAAFAACLFAAFVAGTLAPRLASAHATDDLHLRHHARTYAPIRHTHPYAAVEHTHEPAEPETPAPPTQACTYKHRIIGIPGTTGGGYTGQILISSEEPNATARILAFQHDNGHPIDVLDKEGRAVESVTLSPKVLRLEGARGWHTAIIEHDSARAMRSAAVALRIRSPDVGVSVVPVLGIEHCEPDTNATQ